MATFQEDKKDTDPNIDLDPPDSPNLVYK
jgi:hypothetical protein